MSTRMKTGSAAMQLCVAAALTCVSSALTVFPSGAEDSQRCAAYANLALLQRKIALPLSEGGTGDGCPGMEGPRWASKTSDHFDWCMEAEPAFAEQETAARRDFLLDCTRKKEADQVPDRDVKSCKTYDAFFMCDQSPYADGLKTCKDDGDRILAMVNKIRADRTLLYDDKRDPGFGASRYYHQFNHWKSYDCVKRTRSGGFKVWALEGITNPVNPVDKLGVKELEPRRVDPLDKRGVFERP